MTSYSTPVSLCNQALLRIGSKATIASLNEPSTEARSCNIFYQSTFEQLARTALWNCLRQQAPLALIAAAQGTPENQSGTVLPIPPVPYLYSYLLPADCLQARFLVPSLPQQNTGGTAPLTTASVAMPAIIRGRGKIPFQVSYSVDTNNNPRQIILTDLSQAQLCYTVNCSNPVIWDGLFVEAFISSLAAYLIPAINMNAAMLAGAKQDAMQMIMQARIRDGDEGFTTQSREASWISARENQGASIYNGNAPYIYGNVEMSWPSGY